MQVASLAIYPVKSGRALPLERSEIDARGLSGDRRWMLVDRNHRFVSQREDPRLATLAVQPTAGGLVFALPGGEPVQAPRPDGARRLSVDIWGSMVDASLADDDVNERLSACLKRPVQLVFMDERARRHADPAWAGDDAPVSFADAYPLLLTSTASLAALNEVIVDQGGPPVTMDRFRPNIVVAGAPPWDEDRWAEIQIGAQHVDLVKPCDRCIVPTHDQETGERRGDNQPVKALNKIRRSADERVKGVLFGWNLVARTAGKISVGDPVRVLERRAPWPIRGWS
jgi:uncharacterized protein YcbX